METPALSFVIPTYRLRDVNETVESYDQHFWKNGHSVRIVVFDDSIPANHEKYFPPLWSEPAPTMSFTMSGRGKRTSSSPI